MHAGPRLLPPQRHQVSLRDRSFKQQQINFTTCLKAFTIMRPTLRLLATSANTKAGLLRPAPMALLPPIPLYRRLLRAHRKFLPHEMRMLGDEYIKSEFRAHRDVDKPAHLVRPSPHPSNQLLQRSPLTCFKIGFLTEWQLYAQQIEGEAWVGAKLDPTKVAKMNGMFLVDRCLFIFLFFISSSSVAASPDKNRPASWPTVRADDGNKKAPPRRRRPREWQRQGITFQEHEFWSLRSVQKGINLTLIGFTCNEIMMHRSFVQHTCTGRPRTSYICCDRNASTIQSPCTALTLRA